MAHVALTHEQSPRAFFEKAVEESDQNAPFTALRFTEDVAGAYNFFKGYVEVMAEDGTGVDNDPVAVAEANIRHVAGYCISGVVKDGLTPTEQYKQVLGVWPRVFDAVEIEQLAQLALAQPSESTPDS